MWVGDNSRDGEYVGGGAVAIDNGGTVVDADDAYAMSLIIGADGQARRGLVNLGSEDDRTAVHARCGDGRLNSCGIVVRVVAYRAISFWVKQRSGEPANRGTIRSINCY